MKSKTNGASKRPAAAARKHYPAASRRLPRVEPLLLGASLLALAQHADAQAVLAATNAPAATPVSGLATNPPPAGFSFLPQKPAWLTDLSFGIKETYDDNLFNVSGLGAKEQGSWITTISPVVGFNFAPLLGQASPFQALAFGYSPEVNIFHEQPSENYTANRLAQTIKAGAGDFTVSLENGFNYIDGNHVAPTYSGLDSNRSAYATGAPRERREQIQDRSKFSLTYDQPQWFLRPVASLLLYDLMTDLHTTSGYQNYASRYDVNGGLDFGYKLTPGLAVTLGYRYGHQYQEQFSSVIDPTHTSSPSDYQRVLLGLEGSPWKWLTFSVQGGPDFRNYEADSADHTTPVRDLNPITYYGEATATATITAKDQLSLRYKDWRWVSSTGKLPLTESLYELTYRRKLLDHLSFDLTGRIQSSDYTCGDASSSDRDDWLYSVSPGITWTVNRNLSFNAAYSVDLGRNQEDNITDAGYREFDHQMVSVGMQLKL